MPVRHAQLAMLRRRPTRGAQRGVALLVALILLVVITLVGLAAIGTTIIQNKAASNQFDRQIAFQAAEAALRQGQVAVQDATATRSAPAGFMDCSTPENGTAAANACPGNPFSAATAGTPIAAVSSTVYNSPLAASQPQYLVQYMGRYPGAESTIRQIGGGAQVYGAAAKDEMADYYRITARSGNPADASGRSIVTLQSTFRK